MEQFKIIINAKQPVGPSLLTNKIQFVLNSKLIRVGVQCDSHEFLILLLSNVEKFNKILIQTLFMGSFENVVKCNFDNCLYESKTVNTFYDMSLDANCSGIRSSIKK